MIALQQEIQFEMQNFLNSFFTGVDCSFFDKFLFPYGLYGKSLIKKIAALHFLFSKTDVSSERDAVLRILSNMLKRKRCLRKYMLMLFSAYLRWFFQQKVDRRKKRSIFFNECDVGAYKKDSSVFSIFKKLFFYGDILKKKKLGTLILIGSFATRDYISGQSDIDLIIILKNDVFSDLKRLLYIRKIVGKIMRESFFADVLQHHGPFIFSESDLMAYSEVMMPFEVLKNAVSLSGSVCFDFYEQESKEAAGVLLEKYYISFTKMLAMPYEDLLKDAYSTKYVFQVILLFPSIFLLAKYKPIYKRESFQKIEKYLDTPAKMLLAELSQLRKKNILGLPVLHRRFQDIFRFIPHPFFYPFLARTFFCNGLSVREKARLKSILYLGLKSLIDIMEREKNVI